MEKAKVNEIGLSLDRFFRHITPESYNDLISYLHKSTTPESTKMLEILEGIRDLYLAYSGEDLANNFDAIHAYEDFVNLVYEANQLGMECADLCRKMGQEVRPCADGLNIYVVRYGCIKAIIVDTTEGIAILTPVMAKKMSRYIPLSAKEIEAAGLAKK